YHVPYRILTVLSLLSLIIPRPHISTLFPYTTLFRSPIFCRNDSNSKRTFAFFSFVSFTNCSSSNAASATRWEGIDILNGPLTIFSFDAICSLLILYPILQPTRP